MSLSKDIDPSLRADRSITPKHPDLSQATQGPDGLIIPDLQNEGVGNRTIREAAESAASNLRPGETVRLGGGDPVGTVGEDGSVRLFSDDWELP